GEQEHRLLKLFYARTNRRNFSFQVSKQNTRKRRLDAIGRREPYRNKRHLMQETDNDPLPATNPNRHYHISDSLRYPITLDQFMQDHWNDEATTDFGLKLCNYILTYLGRTGDPTTFTPADRNSVIIQNNKLFEHKILRINFTDYTRHRDQDFVNPRTCSDIMVLAPEDHQYQHPYWYCRVLGIFHTNVLRRSRSNAPPIQVDFLWVRWYSLDESHIHGFSNHRLPHVSFMDSREPTAFGFVNPKDVIHAVHLIPHFETKTTRSLLSVSVARRNDENDKDWCFYDVNM
ncbi:hypothetical protein K435DRAFT_670984, partial [Dendrothele bispora CBS 962.96]